MGEPGISIAGIALAENKLFIARRKPGGDLGEKWEFPGGKVEEGENEEAALIREFREELEVTVQVGPLLGAVSFEHRGKPRLLRAYRVEFSIPHLTLVEHTAWKWASPEEIADLDFADSDLKLLPALQAYLQG
ncbi:DNA mismatch repair protein MutT [Spirochaetia bacterium]|nr:DNA mismatch repair protein MutT [Spirochaetia bacterium]